MAIRRGPVPAHRIAGAHAFAADRANGSRQGAHTDTDTPLRDVSPEATTLLELAIEKKSLSARGFHRVLRVARTIADLQHQPVIDRGHLAEALSYRAMPLLA